MKSRREFLKTAATGALVLGSSAAADKLGFASMLDQNAQHAATGKSRVVVARDAALHGQDGQLDEKRVHGSAGPRHRDLHRARQTRWKRGSRLCRVGTR